MDTDNISLLVSSTERLGLKHCNDFDLSTYLSLCTHNLEMTRLSAWTNTLLLCEAILISAISYKWFSRCKDSVMYLSIIRSFEDVCDIFILLRILR